VLLATVTLTVYFLFAHFRQDEFFALMAEKAQTTAKLLIEVKEIDYKMQKLIDSNTINKLYNDHTQVFDENKKLIYNSNDTLMINWTSAELDQLKLNHRIFKKTGRNDVLGLYYIFEKKGYYVLIAAQDTYDEKLDYLKYLLASAFIIGTVIVWIMSFRLSRRALKPLDNFRKSIQEITDSNLQIRLSEAKKEDEINALANSFNQMMDRIDNAYNRQKEFTANASHELRTPIARITAQLENLQLKKDLDAVTKANLNSISQDTFQLSEVISSLLALADINSREHLFSLLKLRVDEILYSAVTELSKIYGDFKLKFEIENETKGDTGLEILGDETLLKIAFVNLLKNAFIYSDNGIIDCRIKQNIKNIEVHITNTGVVPDIDDTSTLFTTFYRGTNTKHISGSGIGLSIVQRVLKYHNAHIIYKIINKNTNWVTVTFPN
jgi:signal transduction histidine kinase